MKILKKYKLWWRGEIITPSLQEIFDRSRGNNIPDKFKPPLIARFLNPISRFWFKHWQWIIGTIIALLGLYLLFLQQIKSKCDFSGALTHLRG